MFNYELCAAKPRRLASMLLPALLPVLLSAVTVRAEDRVLLVGVGVFPRLVDADLPGIDRDLQRAYDFALELGYKKSQIKVLRDSEATLAAVERAFQEWLVAGAGSQDRVLIYFSTHGTRVPDQANGDEFDDQADEVLLMHDSWIEKPGGQEKLHQVLVDDRFADWLQAIPSTQVMVLIDACHSGTATESAFVPSNGRELVSKAYVYRGMPVSLAQGAFAEDPASDDEPVYLPDGSRVTDWGRRSRSFGRGPGAERNYVVLSATSADQEAWTSAQGSIFTEALAVEAHRAAVGGHPTTLSQLRVQTERYIARHLRRNLRHQPTLGGDARLGQRDLRFHPVAGVQ